MSRLDREEHTAERTPATRRGSVYATWQLVGLGLGLLCCWWRIRALGDVRVHLLAFFGWYVLTFILYLVALWIIHGATGDRSAPENLEPRVLPLRDPSRPPPHASLCGAKAKQSVRGAGGWGPRSASPAARNSLNGIVLTIIFISAAAFRLCLLGMTPTLSDDVYRYHWDGRVQRAGLDPYAYAPNAPELATLRDALWPRVNFPHLRTIYPPLTQRAFQLGLWLHDGLLGQKLVFLLAELVAMACLLGVLRQRALSPLWVAAYAWHPLAILEIAGSGHNDALGIACLWLGLLAWSLRRPTLAVISWGLTFLAKYATVLLVPWLWFRHGMRWRMPLFAVVAAIPIICCPTVISALFSSLSVMAGRFESNASLFLLVVSLVKSPIIARWLVIGMLAVWTLWWAIHQEDPIIFLMAGLAAAALLSPVLHPWYFLWLVPFFCFWRVPALVVLSGTIILAYTVWSGYLAGGQWTVPWWARVLEYGPVLVLGLWELRRLRAPLPDTGTDQAQRPSEVRMRCSSCR